MRLIVPASVPRDMAEQRPTIMHKERLKSPKISKRDDGKFILEKNKRS
jgi:hypothetical protein